MAILSSESKNLPPPSRKQEHCFMDKNIAAGLCCIAKPRALSPSPPSPRKPKFGDLYPKSFQHQLSDDRTVKQGCIRAVAVEKGAPSGSPFRLRLSPGKVSPITDQTAAPAVAYPSHTTAASSISLGKINSSPQALETMKDSSTLFDGLQSKPLQSHTLSSCLVTQHQSAVQERMHTILTQTNPGSAFNDISSSDVKLTLSGGEGCRVTVNVHKQILSSQSRFLAAKLSDRWSKQRVPPYVIDISDCDDVDVYLQTIQLMYSEDLKRALMKENVAKVLGILQVSASIVFEAGINSCLEYLEAVPWSEDEEEKVMSLVSRLQLDNRGASKVLTRLSATDVNGSQDILTGLLESVMKGTDDRARREMTALVAKMLQENAAQKECMDVCKRTLYHACHCSLDLLMRLFKQVENIDILKRQNGEDRGVLIDQIARQADNLHWLVEMLIDQQIADDFLKLWAHQTELAALHMHVPIIFRYEVSRITARLCIAIGKGQVLSPKDVRSQLLQTWFQPLIDDFGWLHRCCKRLDKNVVEEGIGQTILTLPLKQQQEILLGWLNQFSSMGDDCPNLQKAFEIWWRRTFVRPCMDSSLGSS